MVYKVRTLATKPWPPSPPIICKYSLIFFIRLRIATASTIDICETELPCFGPHEVTPSVRSEELQVIEPEYSNEQLVEDNSMVTEFSNSLYKSLSKSRDLIDDVSHLFESDCQQ